MRWHPATQRPTSKGVYWVGGPSGQHYAYWDGDKFGYVSSSKSVALKMKNHNTMQPGQRPWREDRDQFVTKSLLLLTGEQG